MNKVEQKLRTIVMETFLVGGDICDLRGDESFIETGIVDSTGILQLVEFVEQEFGLRVEDEDLIPENLDTINRLVAFVERKQLSSSEGIKRTVQSCDLAACPVGAASSGSN